LLVAVVVGAVVLAMTIGRSAATICALAGVMLVGLTYAEAQFSDRWAESNVKAEVFASKFAQVPMTIGDWEGEDLPVDEMVRRKTGAVGYVSRLYTNRRNQKQVTLWLIVGHSRDICRHTPDVCYPSSGFHKQSNENSTYTFSVDEDLPANFWTNSFIREDKTHRSLNRVFWAWYKPDESDKMDWKAPGYPRFEFGNSRALYKMYFSAQMDSPVQTAEQSPAAEFAIEFLPVVEKALIGDGSDMDADSADSEEAAAA
jgi:hypothetical protein